MREPKAKAKKQGCWGSGSCCGLKRAEQRLISNFIVLQVQALTTENSGWRDRRGKVGYLLSVFVFS